MGLLRLFLLALLPLCVAADAARAQPVFPALNGRIVDEAKLLNESVRGRIETKLAQLESSTGNQFVVVTLRSLQSYDIADYSYQLGRRWGIGQKEKNNGVLLIVAPNERKVRIEVGYGLEGTLTDAVTQLIIQNAILPRFRADDFPGGIERGVDDVIQVLSGDAEDYKRRATERPKPSTSQGLGSFAWIIVLLVIWYFLFVRPRRQSVLSRRRAGWALPPIIAGSSWGGGGGWSGGGGDGGSSGGGFSGGGGSFGGGGSSGSW